MAFLDRHLGKLVWLASTVALALVLGEVQAALPQWLGLHPWTYLGVTGMILVVLHGVSRDTDSLWPFGDSSGQGEASDGAD